MNFPHPIHIHLINFQVVKVYDLILYPNSNNSLYELDFVAHALKLADSSQDKKVAEYQKNVTVNGTIDYDYLNRTLGEIKSINAVRDSLSNIYLED